MAEMLKSGEQYVAGIENEKTAKNHLRPLHSQNLIKVIKEKALRMKGQDKVKIMRAVVKTLKLDHPILRAIILAILKGSKDGRFYEIENDPEIRDMRFFFLGKDLQEVAKVAHNLTCDGLYDVRCQVQKFPDCPRLIPVIELHVELPEKVIKLRGVKAFSEEETKTHFIFLTIECGEIRVAEPGEEITLEMLLK